MSSSKRKHITEKVTTDDDDTHENNNLITQPENINQMPNEMIIAIFSLLPPLELLTNVSLVCTKWRQLALTACLTKPLTLVFYGKYSSRRNSGSKYLFYHITTNQALTFFDVPFEKDLNSYALYRPLDALSLIAPLNIFENITELVFCGSYSDFRLSISAERFHEFITKCCTKLTHLKLLVTESTGYDDGFDFQTSIWRVLDQVQLSSLEHVSILSNRDDCMQGAENLLPKLKQFFFEWSCDFMPTLRLLNHQTCTSIGIYWKENATSDQIKSNLTQLRLQLPTIWQRITRISDPFIDRHSFKPEDAVVNWIEPESLHFLQLHCNRTKDYLAYYKLMSLLPRLNHLCIQILKTKTETHNELFHFVRETHSIRSRFPTHKANSVKCVTFCTPSTVLSQLERDPDFSVGFSYECTFEPAKLLFPNIQSMTFLYCEGLTFNPLITRGQWSFKGLPYFIELYLRFINGIGLYSRSF